MKNNILAGQFSDSPLLHVWCFLYWASGMAIVY